MSNLSNTTNPSEVIQHVLCNQILYYNVLKSVEKARYARSIGGTYCLFFRNPCTKEFTTVKEDRLIQIYDNNCCLSWCNCVERTVGLILLNSNFFLDVLHSYQRALQMRADSKEYCKSFKIPLYLFPYIEESQRCITLCGKTLISMADSCCYAKK